MNLPNSIPSKSHQNKIKLHCLFENLKNEFSGYKTNDLLIFTNPDVMMLKKHV